MMKSTFALALASTLMFGAGTAVVHAEGGTEITSGYHDGAGKRKRQAKRKHRRRQQNRAFRAGRTFARIDANNDNAVDLDEYLAWRGTRFEDFDADKDGVVTPAEVEAGLKKRMERARERIVERLDADKDGKISRAEFDEPAKQRFARIDRDDNGKVEAREFMRMGKRGGRGGRDGEMRKRRRGGDDGGVGNGSSEN